MHPFTMEMAAILVHSSIDFHFAPKWLPCVLPSAVTSCTNAQSLSLLRRYRSGASRSQLAERRSLARVLSRKFLFGGSFKYVWEGPTRSVKILQRVHGEM